MKSCTETDHLIATREILKNAIQTTKHIAASIDKTSCKLQEINRNLASRENHTRKMVSKCALREIGIHLDRAMGPTFSVLRVADLVNELWHSLEINHPGSDLYMYISMIRKLEGALKLLSSNSSLVILWLKDLIQFLENSAYDFCYPNVPKIMTILFHLQGKRESFCQQKGILSSAFDKLEIQYRRLLAEHSLPLLPSYNHETPSSFPEHVIRDLHAISEVLAANNRLDKCLSIYTEVRLTNARATFKGLDLDYLDMDLSEFETLDGYICQWDNQMEFVVRHMLHAEHKLYSEVFHEKVGSKCFARISINCGFLDLINYGKIISEGKKDAMKLLSLLKLFATLDRLRLDFNNLFIGDFCEEIQNQTRGIVKKVVYAACEIFWELLIQVELQRASHPPPDGSVPRLVQFITEYLNQLLEEENSSYLIRVLQIYQVWNNVEFEKEIIFNEIHKIMKALAINLETWAKMYNDDSALSCVFMMNSHWFFCKKIGGTKLGYLMGGDSWLKEHEASVKYYVEMYVRASWGRVLVLLSEEDITLFPRGRAIDRDLVKKRISMFSDAIDKIYKKQCKWILHDKALRIKICHVVMQAIIPPYKKYLGRVTIHGNDQNSNVKYNETSLENLFCSLFQPKLDMYGRSKCTDIIGIKHFGIYHLAAA